MTFLNTVTQRDLEYFFSQNNITDDTTIYMVSNGVEAVNKLELWEWFRTYSPPEDRGYIFDNHPNINAIAHETEIVDHSGMSFAYTMRYLQKIANTEFENIPIAIELEFQPPPPKKSLVRLFSKTKIFSEKNKTDKKLKRHNTRFNIKNIILTNIR